MEKSKIKITKQDSNSNDDDDGVDDFDTHVFMLRGNDDEVIIDDQVTTMDPYWSQSSSPASNNDWNQPSYDLREYFPYSSSPSTITSDDEEVKWRIEYDRAVKKHRTDHPDFDHDFYIDIHNIICPHWLDSG